MGDLLQGGACGCQRQRGYLHDGRSPVEAAVPVAVRELHLDRRRVGLGEDVLRGDEIAFRLNDPQGVLPPPFPVFGTWTQFDEDEPMNQAELDG